MELKQLKRSALGTQLEKRRTQFVKDAFFATSVRPVKDNALQLEVCQNRLLGGRKRTLLGVLNRSDNRFGSDTTLLFDWITFTPEDLVKAIPDFPLTLEQLKEVAKTWKPDGPTGAEANVFPVIKTIKKIAISHDENGNPIEYATPIITVTEVTENQIRNGEFYRASGANQEEQIRRAVEDEYRVMKTGSEPDADYIVHPETGEKIFRFTRTEFLEDKPVDIIIQGKMTLNDYNKTKTSVSSQRDPEKVLNFENEPDAV